jgi:hypothetical protein
VHTSALLPERARVFEAVGHQPFVEGADQSSLGGDDEQADRRVRRTGAEQGFPLIAAERQHHPLKHLPNLRAVTA